MLRTVRATCYVTALREGGSLPGIVEADDEGTYVTKFRGAGQGTAALIAEVVVGELARALGLRVPELVLVAFEQEIARHEPDEEVQDLLAASVGLNLGMDFLPGAVGYDGVRWRPPVAEAATVAWLDAYTANVDRTWRNPNLLVWHRELWAVDHGAALVFQHAWPPAAAWSGRVYDLSGHALAPVFAGLDAEALADVDTRLAARVTPELLAAVLGLVPDEWLVDAAVLAGREPSAAASRDRYLEYLLPRLEGDRPWRPGAGGPVATGGARAVPA